MSNPANNDFLRDLTRRTFFKQMGYGIGGLALSSILAESVMAQAHAASGADMVTVAVPNNASAYCRIPSSNSWLDM